MALKFRRGTTAQQSGSLAFGEPYVNTTLGTLLIGGPTGDIVLSTAGTGSTGTFGAISGSGLDITGNANIAGNLTLGGNITIGDATTDTVVINADLSSSIIPDTTNVFDIGSPTKLYKNVYANTISASVVEIMSGSNPELRLNNKTTGIAYHIQNGDGGNLTIHNPTVGRLAVSFLSSSTHANVLLYGDLGVSQSVTANRLVASTISGSVSGSINGIGNVTDYSASVASKFTTLGTYTASVDGRFTTLATLTGSNSIRLTNLETTTASLNTSVSNLNTLTASALTRLTALEVETTNLELFSASILTQNTALATITGSLIATASANRIDTSNLETFSASALTRLTALEVETSNLETFSGSQLSKDSTLATYTGSNDTKWSTLGSLSGSFARTNSANTFSGNQIITGSLYVSQDLVVGGSSSIQTISASRLDIGDNIIQLNVNSPSLRFGGLAINDSGSAGSSGSFLYDSLHDEFIFVHKGNGINVTSSHFVLGPETYDNLGTETYLTNNRLPKGTGKEHLVDSQISDDGTTVSIGGALTVTGNITGPIRATNGVVSGSSQITYASISSIPAGIVSGSSQLTSILPAGVVSGSSQIAHDSTTGYSANRHIDHTAVTLTAGSGLTGGGNISTNRTFAVGAGSYITVNADDVAVNTATLIPAISGTILSSITGDVTITAGGVATIAANSVALGTDTTGNYVASLVAGTNITLANNTGEGATPTIGLTNNTISGISLGSNLAALTIGTGLSGTSYNGSTAVTIANTGVTSNVAGTGVSVSGATGAVTISIGQSVATSASPTFAGLTINGAITATGDITAYFTSDKRHKNNIQTIPNALEKVSKLNGVTWEWNDDVNEVTKQSPKTGLIAQEVLEVLPEVVKQKEDGFLGLDYSKMMGLLVEAIKEQQSQIEELKSKLGYN
jgi:hypothetical protein